MKTVVFISNFMGEGGAARVIATVAESLSVRGYEVIIASFPLQGFEYTIPKGVKKENLEIGDSRGIKRKIKRIKAIRGLMNKYLDATYIAFEDFVGMEAVVASIGKKHRVIVSERNDPNQVKNKVKKTLRNYLFGKADVVVCQTKDAVLSFPLKVQKKSKVILNPIKSGLPIWDAENHNEIIINFCRLVKQKNIPMLLEAFEQVHKKYSSYELLIYGDGDEKSNIMSIIEEKNLNEVVTIKPFSHDIHKVASRCRMFVSSSDFEGLSNSMLEAMAMGMPVICTDCPIGGASMVIDNGVNGYLVPVGDANILAEKMLSIIENNVTAMKLSKEAIKINDRLAVDKIVDLWMEII